MPRKWADPPSIEVDLNIPILITIAQGIALWAEFNWWILAVIGVAPIRWLGGWCTYGLAAACAFVLKAIDDNCSQKPKDGE